MSGGSTSELERHASDSNELEQLEGSDVEYHASNDDHPSVKPLVLDC